MLTVSAAMYFLTLFLPVVVGIPQGMTSFVAPSSCPRFGCDYTLSGRLIRYYWEASTWHTTITAATVIEIVNTVDDTTRTITQLNIIPSGYTYTPVPTNAQGTQAYTITYTSYGETTPTTTVLAFPTTFYEHPWGYRWNGSLYTQLDGEPSPTCVYVPPSGSLVSLQPFSQETPTEVPIHPSGIEDPEGLLWKLQDDDFDVPGAYLNEGAIQNCQSGAISPAFASLGARFLIETSKSFEGGSETPAPTLEAPLPTQAPVAATPTASETVEPAPTAEEITPSPTTLDTGPVAPPRPPSTNNAVEATRPADAEPSSPAVLVPATTSAGQGGHGVVTPTQAAPIPPPAEPSPALSMANRFLSAGKMELVVGSAAFATLLLIIGL